MASLHPLAIRPSYALIGYQVSYIQKRDLGFSGTIQGKVKMLC